MFPKVVVPVGMPLSVLQIYTLLFLSSFLHDEKYLKLKQRVYFSSSDPLYSIDFPVYHLEKKLKQKFYPDFVPLHLIYYLPLAYSASELFSNLEFLDKDVEILMFMFAGNKTQF